MTLVGGKKHTKKKVVEKNWLDLNALHTSRNSWTISSPVSSSPYSPRHGPKCSGLRRQLTWKTLYLRKWAHLVWKDLNDSALMEESLTAIEVGLSESTTSQPQHCWHWGPDNGLLKMQETWVQSLGQEDILEKEMATHPNILIWEIPRTEYCISKLGTKIIPCSPQGERRKGNLETLIVVLGSCVASIKMKNH